MRTRQGACVAAYRAVAITVGVEHVRREPSTLLNTQNKHNEDVSDATAAYTTAAQETRACQRTVRAVISSGAMRLTRKVHAHNATTTYTNNTNADCAQQQQSLTKRQYAHSQIAANCATDDRGRMARGFVNKNKQHVVQRGCWYRECVLC